MEAPPFLPPRSASHLCPKVSQRPAWSSLSPRDHRTVLLSARSTSEMQALTLASCKLSTRKPDARRLCKRANMRSPRGPARKAIVLKCNNVVTKMHTKERKPREEEEDDDGFWQLLLHAKCHARFYTMLPTLVPPGCHC